MGKQLCLPRCLAAPAAARFGAVPGHSDQAPAATSPSGLNLGKRDQRLVIHASAEDPHQPQPAHQFSIQTHLPRAPRSPSPPARGCAAQVQTPHRLETLKHLGKEKQFLKVIGSSCYNRGRETISAASDVFALLKQPACCKTGNQFSAGKTRGRGPKRLLELGRKVRIPDIPCPHFQPRNTLCLHQGKSKTPADSDPL